MTHAILLGCLQGATEFLPVSSSAHLVAAQVLLGAGEPGIYLEVSVHFGTLLAILAVFGREVARIAAEGVQGAWLWLRGAGPEELRRRTPRLSTAVAVLVGVLPATCAGALLTAQVEAAFESVTAAGAFLMVTGMILLAGRAAGPGRAKEPGAARGLLVGIAQALALLPGISRSGSTIVAGRLLGLKRAAAARFSFVLAVPALLGAAGWTLVRGSAGGELPPVPVLAAAAAAAGLVGTLCLLALLRAVHRGRLHWFAAYCLPAGAAMLVAGLATG